MNYTDPRIDRIAHELAELTGDNAEAIILKALENQLRLTRKPADADEVMQALDDFEAYYASLPVLDNRSPEEILGYDEHGLPS